MVTANDNARKKMIALFAVIVVFIDIFLVRIIQCNEYAKMINRWGRKGPQRGTF